MGVGLRSRISRRGLEINTIRDRTHLAKTDFAPTPSDFMSHWHEGEIVLQGPREREATLLGLRWLAKLVKGQEALNP